MLGQELRKTMMVMESYYSVWSAGEAKRSFSIEIIQQIVCDLSVGSKQCKRNSSQRSNHIAGLFFFLRTHSLKFVTPKND